MNLNNKQLSLIITFCLMGILTLTVYNIRLNDKQEEEFLYELTFDEELLKEELPEEEPVPMEKLETHMAYNEAAKSRFASELDEFKTLEELQEEAEDKAGESEELNELSENLGLAKEFTERLKKQKELLEKSQKKEKDKEPINIKRRTTISYSLVDRSKIDIPNPIYTCESFGKVVINITVDEKGRVTEASFNETSSTTSNGCLVENAIEYAKMARFTPKSGKPEQIGTVTYQFQGE